MTRAIQWPFSVRSESFPTAEPTPLPGRHCRFTAIDGRAAGRGPGGPGKPSAWRRVSEPCAQAVPCASFAGRFSLVTGNFLGNVTVRVGWFGRRAAHTAVWGNYWAAHSLAIYRKLPLHDRHEIFDG